MPKNILEIYCRTCGAPAKFDIIRQQYLCGYCGGTVGIDEAVSEKQGFRQIRRGRLQKEIKQFSLFQASCPNCGAGIVFAENEAISSCPFCRTSMVRSAYIKADDMPESIIPFAITLPEAKAQLQKWCADNQRRPEAKKLRGMTEELAGFYLPYELVRGPVHMKAARMDGFSSYACEGFINDEFVNCSRQLDNLLLDGMEPFDTDALREFDFSYAAGQKIKTADIAGEELETRVRSEVSELYAPAIRRTLETRAVEVSSDVSSAFTLPVLLPVYSIVKDNIMAAVNGQTGKVSVRAMKDSHYYFLPWWLKAIVSTLAFTLIIFAALRLSGMTARESILLTAILALFFIIVTLCYYSDTVRNSFSVVSGREIFTSGSETFRRDRGELVLSDQILERKIYKPVFFADLDGEKKPVILKFTTPGRILKTALLCIIALFLPVILALLINGFDFQKLNLGGSAVWFCIAVPVVPVYLLKFGIAERHDAPLIYMIGDDGKQKRYRKKPSLHISRDTVGTVLRVLLVPPESLAVWFAILSFVVMVYLTAFGFD